MPLGSSAALSWASLLFLFLLSEIPGKRASGKGGYKKRKAMPAAPAEQPRSPAVISPLGNVVGRRRGGHVWATEEE